MATLLQIFHIQSNDTFKARCYAAISKAAYDIINESISIPNHSQRLLWAKDALVEAEGAAERMLWAIVQNPTIQTNGNDSTDSDIQYVVNSFVDLFATTLY